MAAPERTVLFRPRTVLELLGLTLVVGLGVLVLFHAWRAFTWILVALLLALALDPVVRSFERRGMSRALASAIVFALAAVSIGALAFLVVPPIVREINDLIVEAPRYVADLTAGKGRFGFLERDFQVVERVRAQLAGVKAADLLGLGQPAVSVARGVIAAVFGVVAVGFLTLFMLIEGPRLVARFLEAVPSQSRPRWERITRGTSRAVSGWAAGALLVSLLAGAGSTIVLLALGIPFAFALGLLVAILDLIPLAGAVVAGLILSAVAFTQGVVKGIVVLVFFIVYQQLENHIVLPLVYGRTVKLSALTVLAAVLIGAELAGILGVLLAIPIAATAQVTLEEVRRWRRESRMPTVPPAVPEPPPPSEV